MNPGTFERIFISVAQFLIMVLTRASVNLAKKKTQFENCYLIANHFAKKHLITNKARKIVKV